MRWYEYKLEVDELHASDDLKAKLLAMQSEQAKASGPVPAGQKAKAKPRRKAVRFPVRRVLPIAACLAVCVVGANVLLGINLVGFGSSGASASSTAAISRSYAVADYGLSTAQENSMDVAAYDGEVTAGTADGASSVSLSESSVHQSEIIYTADLYLETKDYDAAYEALTAAVDAADGYVESSREDSDTGSSRYLNLTLRIPQENYQSFLAAVAEVGNLTSRVERAEDVTTQYMDIEARLANLEAQRTRLQELQASAETLSDLLDIESQLSDVQYELESWQSQLNWYSDQVTCSTVYVSLSEVGEYTPTTESFGERIAAALRDGWSSFVTGSQDVFIWLLGIWPVVLIAAVVIVVVLVRRRRRK